MKYLVKLTKQQRKLRNRKERTPRRPRGLTRRPRVVPTPDAWGLLPAPKFTLPALIALIGWIFIDLSRAVKTRRSHEAHLYGIHAFCGLPGSGKTMSMTRELDNLRRRYGDKILISTNYFYKGEDFHFSDWKQIQERYDKPVVFGWDELQNEFHSRKSQTFPIPLVQELTQNRKGLGKMILYTTQKYNTVDKTFRNLTHSVVDCKTYFNRMTSCRHYRAAVFEAREEAVSLNAKMKNKPFKKEKFIQDDAIRNRYDSFQRIDYLAALDYQLPSAGADA